MGKAGFNYKTVKFDFTDPQITEVTVEIEWWGDYPIAAVKNIYKKSFPARIPAIDIFKKEIPKVLDW